MPEKQWYGVTCEATSVEVPCVVCGCKGWIDKATWEYHRNGETAKGSRIICGSCFGLFFMRTGKRNPEDVVLSDRPEVKFP